LAAVGEDEQTNVREYARRIWKRKLLILTVCGVCVALTLAYCVVTKPKYTATATVLLEPSISQTLIAANFPTGGIPIVNVPDGIQVIESSAVQDIAQKTVPNPPTVSASQVGLTDVVQVTVTSGNAQVAAAAANAYAHAYIQYEQSQTVNTFKSAEAQLQNKVNTVQLAIANLNAQIKSAPPTSNTTPEETQLGNLEDQLTTLEDQLQNYQFYATQGTGQEAGQVISEAVPPSKPSSPKTVSWTIIAAVIGLLLGVGLAMILDALSDHDTKVEPEHASTTPSVRLRTATAVPRRQIDDTPASSGA
jgi:uncharacterized protein involved in exopolysaccharide biosynthesis